MARISGSMFSAIPQSYPAFHVSHLNCPRPYNGTGKSTIYNAAGVKQATVVTVPPPPGSTPGTMSTPIGIVFNGNAADFLLSAGPPARQAIFIFATEDGTISGWNPNVNATTAIVKVNHSGTAIYKGLTIGTFNGADFLYAANFGGTGRVEVYDATWTAASVPGGFADPQLPPGYAPFNVQNIDRNIFVMFALQGEPPDEVDGRKLGYVDEFDSGGNLLLRLQHGPWLNAPSGVAKAPANFGKFSGDLLVGNFGSGEIAAFNATSGGFRGRLHIEKGTLVIPWVVGTCVWSQHRQ